MQLAARHKADPLVRPATTASFPGEGSGTLSRDLSNMVFSPHNMSFYVSGWKVGDFLVSKIVNHHDKNQIYRFKPPFAGFFKNKIQPPKKQI